MNLLDTIYSLPIGGKDYCAREVEYLNPVYIWYAYGAYDFRGAITNYQIDSIWHTINERNGPEKWEILTSQLLMLPVALNYSCTNHRNSSPYINDIDVRYNNQWIFSLSDTPFGQRVSRIWIADTLKFLQSLNIEHNQEEKDL